MLLFHGLAMHLVLACALLRRCVCGSVAMSHGGFHSHGAIPMTMDGLFHGKSIYKWMMTGGTPHDYGKPPHVLSDSILQECREPQRIDQRQCIWKPEFFVHLEVHLLTKISRSETLHLTTFTTVSFASLWALLLKGSNFCLRFHGRHLEDLRSEGFIAMMWPSYKWYIPCICFNHPSG